MQKIMVATDFSTRSDLAVRRAGLLARDRGARIMLLHVVDDDRPERLVAEEVATARELLGATAGSAFRDLRCEVHVALGDPFDSIAKTARDSAADLIVMGAHRKQMLKRRERVAPSGKRPYDGLSRRQSEEGSAHRREYRNERLR